MDLAALLSDLDRPAWSQLSHAYGPAEDVPGLLRSLTDADGGTAAEAEYELWSSLVHQGSVYAATVPAVPFLARLAAAGVRRAKLLGMLGCIAESTDGRGLPAPDAARAAVAQQLGLLLPLLADQEPEVRRAAAWTVAQCRALAGPQARAALLARWAAESDPGVRADVLTACTVLAPEAAQAWYSAATDRSATGPVRVAALLASVRAGLAWGPEQADAVTELLPMWRHAEGSAWERGPLRALATALQERGDVTAAIDVVSRALHGARPGIGASPAVRPEAVPEQTAKEAVWAADSLARRSRAAPARLLPAMVPLLADPAAADEVITALTTWGVPAPEALPGLRELAVGRGEHADRALAALLDLGEPTAMELLAGHMAERPRALAAAAELARRTIPAARLRFSGALLDAIRTRLTAEPPREKRSLFAGGPDQVNEPGRLAAVLQGWGPAAREAIPDMLSAMPRHSMTMSHALASVADPARDPQVVAALHAQAERGSLPARHAAALALHRLTGDVAPLLSVLLTMLAEPNGRHVHALKRAADLGDTALPLLPPLLEVLAGPASARATPAALDQALAVADLVCALSGPHEAVLPVVLEGLARAAEHPGDEAKHAAELAARLGRLAGPAVPLLLPMLDDRKLAPAAVRALHAIHPGSDAPAGLPLTTLADRTVATLRPGGYHHWLLDALRTVAALPPTAFTPAQLDVIRTMVESDRRFVGAGSQHEIIQDDERVRAEARRVLAALDLP